MTALTIVVLVVAAVFTVVTLASLVGALVTWEQEKKALSQEDAQDKKTQKYRLLAAALVALLLAIVFGLWGYILYDNDANENGAAGEASGEVAVDERVGATALRIDCDLPIVNGVYPSREDNLPPYASGPSMRSLSAEEVFDEFSKRIHESEVQRAYISGELGRDLVLTGKFGAGELNAWADAFANDDLLSEEVMERLCALSFSATPVSEETVSAGESFMILTIDPVGVERPTISTVDNYIMPVGGLDLWQFKLEAIGDTTPLEELRSVIFEPTLGVFFIPAGAMLDAKEDSGDVDFGELFGDETQDGVLAMDSTTTSTSTAPDGTVTSTSTAPDGTVTVVTTTPDGKVTTVTTGPGTTVAPGTTVPGPSCPGDPGCPTPTTTIVVTPTTCPDCGTTTTSTTKPKPPPTTTTTTTTRPPTTTTTQPPQWPSWSSSAWCDISGAIAYYRATASGGAGVTFGFSPGKDLSTADYGTSGITITVTAYWNGQRQTDSHPIGECGKGDPPPPPPP